MPWSFCILQRYNLSLGHRLLSRGRNASYVGNLLEIMLPNIVGGPKESWKVYS